MLLGSIMVCLSHKISDTLVLVDKTKSGDYSMPRAKAASLVL